MRTTDGQTTSVWMNIAMPSGTPLMGNARADVCVVGAGIAGMTTAYLLARENRSVIVLDSGEIGGGETGRTTAHLTCVIDDRVMELERMHGEETARLAVESHAAAINRIEQIVLLERIACDFERLDGYLFLPPGESAEYLEKEFEALHRAGLVDTSWVSRAPIHGFDTGRALRFPNQATFHPLKYLKGITRAFLHMGGRVCTGTHVEERFEDGPLVRVHTAAGYTVTASELVVASNAPAINFLEVIAKQTAMRTYAIAASVPRGSVAHALYWDTQQPYHYVRLYTDALPDDMLIIGGEDHKTGQADDTGERFTRLESWMRERFPQASAVTARWSGQVLEPVDGIAFIGRFDKGERNVYVVSGDSGQGMTHGTIAGMLITDLIMDRANPWEAVYAPARKALRAVPEFVAEAANNVQQYADWILPGEVRSADAIEPGTGAIVRKGVRKIAAYRAPDGKLHEMSATCTHLGCIVGWNATEHTWDCPCHGSRFEARGDVINGPATERLKREPAGTTPRPTQRRRVRRKKQT